MSDRIPLEQVQDKEPQQSPRDYNPSIPSSQNDLGTMQDLHELSIMLGFEHGFDGSNAEFIYEWAKQYTGEPGGPKVLGHIKDTIRLLGATEQGPQLLRKLSMYAKLDTKQSEIQSSKENLIS